MERINYRYNKAKLGKWDRFRDNRSKLVDDYITLRAK